MYDPRQVAILVKFRQSPAFEDKTAACLGYRFDGHVFRVTLPTKAGATEYRVAPDGFRALQNPVLVATADTHLIVVQGLVEEHATEVWRFDDSGESWLRVFTVDPDTGTESYQTHPAEDVELRACVEPGRGADVLAYLRRLVAALPDDDPLRRAYGAMRRVHGDSALARYLSGEPIAPRGLPADVLEATLFPFSFNPSQRDAVLSALTHPIAVIDGPPGTGKTQTILNLIANIVVEPGATVGVVSFNNAAVDNVRDRLDKHGVGFMAAALGNKNRIGAFCEGQGARNQEVEQFRSQPPPGDVDPRELAVLANRLGSLQQRDRRVAELKERAAAYRVEQRHFEERIGDEALPELDDLPLLSRSSERVVQYLAESEHVHQRAGAVERLIARVRGYFRYGSTRFLDPDDTQTVLQLQRAFYRKRVEELEREIAQGEADLESGQFTSLAATHRRLSEQALHAALHRRYAGTTSRIYDADGYRSQFSAFTQDYPVILSTCHSLKRNLPSNHLLDYLIIDEASQVDLLAAALALSCCRTLIVVGDERQLPQIANLDAARRAGEAPHPAFAYDQHSILTSLVALHGDALPRTLLREHYRCHPDIIGFCNKKFYGDQLIPFTWGRTGNDPLRVIRTPPGEHMRHLRQGGNINQREAELVAKTILPEHFHGVDPHRIGIVTPYRRQVGTITDALGQAEDLLDQGTEVDTVHKFQGREKDIVIMSAVLDGTRQGAIAAGFADGAHLINVAVSRAVEEFVLVAHHKNPPRARNLRDLADYIRYRYPNNDQINETVISVFDLLYREYSRHLKPLAQRLRGEMDYKSEDIIWTVLHEILERPEYSQLAVHAHVRLRHLIVKPQRLSPPQVAFVNRASHVDFLIHNKTTNRALLAIEVNGFAFHQNDPVQQARDRLKEEICASQGLRLLPLPTTGSGEVARIVAALDAELAAPTYAAEDGTPERTG
ncbi:AAA domain-containing protein [Tessaracoccus caeni]|uniref:AAA domain-containing protein n=1 Tax=Tessaracoccus caeni TaxID=3031239 RepID=UPI0023DB75F4|nr:AAA domain-containing protein [Tessaracoccus caeni]MDF1487961.1 AAA domain-containing protein [Tessaracoccus caeni]